MRRAWTTLGLTVVTAVAIASGAAAQAPSSRLTHHRHAGGALHHSSLHGYGHGPAHVGFADGTRGTGHRAHFADLVGDPYSGLGFYQLPLPYRIGAYRYHMRTARPPWQNPIRQAVAADASRYGYWIPVDPGYRYGVFDPYDGVGSPFFAGYYSAGDRDNDDDGPIFGRPLE